MTQRKWGLYLSLSRIKIKQGHSWVEGEGNEQHGVMNQVKRKQTPWLSSLHTFKKKLQWFMINWQYTIKDINDWLWMMHWRSRNRTSWYYWLFLLVSHRASSLWIVQNNKKCHQPPRESDTLSFVSLHPSMTYWVFVIDFWNGSFEW